MKKAIFKPLIWVMDAMVDGLCPWVGKSMEDRNPILVTADPAQTGGHGQPASEKRSFGAGAYSVTIRLPHFACLTFPRCRWWSGFDLTVHLFSHVA